MEEIYQKVKTAIEKFNLMKNGDRVLIGVSGGIDSMTLLTILNDLKDTLKIEIAVATFNHRIRIESDKEVEFVRNYVQKLGIPFFEGSGDVLKYKSESKKSLEDAARELRLRFLKEIKEANNFGKIALAHNLNDFVETVFMHLMKGSGTKGIISLLGNESDIIHPLILVTRSEIEAFANARNLPFITDYTNFSLMYERNILRHQILPLISSLYKNFELHIYHFSEILYEENKFLEQITEMEFKKVLLTEDEIDLNTFNSLPLAIKRRILQIILKDNASYEKIEEAVNFLQSTARRMNIGKDLCLVKNGKSFYLENATPFSIDAEYILDIGSTTMIPEAKIKIVSQITNSVEIDTTKSDIAYFDLDKLKLPLKVRFRKPGDYVILKIGKKKLQDIFVDEHIRRDKRYRIPIIEDANGNILWVVGVKRSDIAKVDESTSKVLILKAIPLK